MTTEDRFKQDNSIYQRRETYIYLIIEYFLIGFILATGPVVATNPILIFIEIIGIWYLFWVFWTNKVSKFDLSYRPKSKARLIAKGPYKYIRHPFPIAVLLITFVLIINHLTILRLVSWLLLIVIIIFRVRYEEKIFSEYFNDYSLYKQRTYKLIPFIF